jgi:gluconate 5-dehydrogenase
VTGDFEQSTFIVCGGSGHLGEALVHALLDNEATVINISSKDILHPELKHNSNYIFFKADLMDHSKVVEIALKIEKITTPVIRGLINLASRSPRGISLDCPAEELIETYAQVLAPSWNSISAFKGLMAKNSSVVNVGSLWGSLSPDPRMYLDLGNEPSVGLPPAKGAVAQLTKYLAVLLASEGIRVNTIEPGWFPAKRGAPRQDYIAGISNRIPMGRIGEKHELISTFLYLLNPKSTYITGQTITVDGGYSIW